MIEILARLLKSLEKDEIAETLYLMQGRVVPRFIPLEFNVARRLIMRSLAEAFLLEAETIEDSFKELGDLGLVVEKLQKSTKSSLTIKEVYQLLYDIAILGGTGSQEAKVGKIADLIKSCDSVSSKYVIRMILGNLRLGLSDKSALDALSIASVGDKSYREVLDKAYGARSDIGFIAEEIFMKGIEVLEDIKFVAGVPIASMLCERESTIKKIMERGDEWIVQPKYDGLRCQIHYDRSGFKGVSYQISQGELLECGLENARIFSRNLENLTNMFPDIVKAIEKLGIDSVILDSEAVGYDHKTKEFIPFQETIQRKRKYKIAELAKEVPIKVFAFDILYLDNKDLSELELNERLKILEKILKHGKTEDIIEFTPSRKVRSVESFEEIFEEYVALGVEGIVAKLPASLYEPGKRGFDWIKFKKSAKGHLIDNVDAVVLGYYKGRGARAKFGIGAILIGVLNKGNGNFESIAKVGTGIKDEEWGRIRKRLDDISQKKKPSIVDVAKMLQPDVWVRPEVVVVVDADEVTKSPNHKAGFSKGKGYSLRFPRLKEFDRKDKASEDVTTVKEIGDMFKLQYKKKVLEGTLVMY